MSSGDRLREVRLPRAGLIAGALGLAAFALLVFWSRRLFFFSDEWTYVSELSGASARYYLEPHNEHWITLTKLSYRVLLKLFGVRTYVPFMAVLAALHAAAGLFLFALVRRRAGDLLALAALVLFLFMGYGYEDLIWAAQIAFVGSVACGLLALLLLDEPASSPPRLAAAAVALIAGLMFSGIGLVFLGAALVELALDPQRRGHLFTLLPAFVAYGAWYLALGRHAVGVQRNPFSLGALSSLVDYLPTGMGAAIAGFVGLDPLWSLWALAGLAALAGGALAARRRLDPRVLGPAAGLVGLFVLSGLVRAQFGTAQATASRYIYVGAVFAALLAAESARDLRLSRGWQFVLGAVVVVATLHSGSVLVGQYRAWADEESSQRAELEALGAVRDAPDLDRQAFVDPERHILITIGDYFHLVEVYGSPVPRVSRADLADLPADSVDRALGNGFGSRVTVEPATPLLACQRVAPPGASSSVQVPGGGSVGYSESPIRPVNVFLSFASGSPAAPPRRFEPTTGHIRIHVPDAGLPGPWTVTVQPEVNVPGAICSGTAS